MRPSNLPFKAPYALAFLYLLAFLPGVTSLFSFFSQNAPLHASPLHSYLSGATFHTSFPLR